MMQPLDMRDLDEDHDDMSPMEKAMRSLVNFEDISKPIEALQDRKSRGVRETHNQAKQSYAMMFSSSKRLPAALLHQLSY
jgi:hypothetical protein